MDANGDMGIEDRKACRNGRCNAGIRGEEHGENKKKNQLIVQNKGKTLRRREKNPVRRERERERDVTFEVDDETTSCYRDETLLVYLHVV